MNRTIFSDKYLFLTNAIISASLSGVGDAIEQKCQVLKDKDKKEEEFDYVRSRNMCISGVSCKIRFWANNSLRIVRHLNLKSTEILNLTHLKSIKILPQSCDDVTCLSDYIQRRFSKIFKRVFFQNQIFFQVGMGNIFWPFTTSFLHSLQVIVGLFGHQWYRWLDGKYPGRTARVVTYKVLMDTLVFSPSQILFFFTTMGLLERSSPKKVGEEIIEKGKVLYLFEWMIWAPLQVRYENLRFTEANFGTETRRMYQKSQKATPAISYVEIPRFNFSFQFFRW